MKYYLTNQKLDTILYDIGEEYKDLLIERVLEDSNEIDIASLRLQDILLLDEKIKYELRIDKKMKKRNRLMQSYSILGLLYSVFGVMLLLLSTSQDDYNLNRLTILSVCITTLGLFVSVFAMLFRFMLKNRYRNFHSAKDQISPAKIINKWNELEAMLYQITPDSDALTLNHVMDHLTMSRTITEYERDLILDFLRVRGHMLERHGKISDKFEAECKDILKEINPLITRLKKLM